MRFFLKYVIFARRDLYENPTFVIQLKVHCNLKRYRSKLQEALILRKLQEYIRNFGNNSWNILHNTILKYKEER